MSASYMLRMSGHDFGYARVVKVGSRVRHFGTKQWGIVMLVEPQHDGTAELVVDPMPVRYTSLSGHRKYGATLHDRKTCKECNIFNLLHNKGPCRLCTDEKLCPEGEREKLLDERPRGWATYHLDRCESPQEVIREAQTHTCMRCEHPEWYDDKKPCTVKDELRRYHAHAISIIARVAAEPDLGRRLINATHP